MLLDRILVALQKRFEEEPYAQMFAIKIAALEEGRSVLEMRTTQQMNNLLSMTHGAAIYSLVDAAFELAVNSHGTVAVAISVNVNYINAPKVGELLQAEGREVNASRRIAACDVTVTGEDGRLIATCQALAYRKDEMLPFLHA